MADGESRQRSGGAAHAAASGLKWFARARWLTLLFGGGGTCCTWCGLPCLGCLVIPLALVLLLYALCKIPFAGAVLGATLGLSGICAGF